LDFFHGDVPDWAFQSLFGQFPWAVAKNRLSTDEFSLGYRGRTWSASPPVRHVSRLAERDSVEKM